MPTQNEYEVEKCPCKSNPAAAELRRQEVEQGRLVRLQQSGPPFGCIVADPPWRFGNKASRAAAENHYPTMATHEIATMLVHGYPIHQIAAPSAHLYLWVTAGHMEDAFKVLWAWDFQFVMTLPWVKMKDGAPQMGMGNYFRHAHEECLFATRNKQTALAHDELSVILAPRGDHSEKPEALQDKAERVSPGPYIELFARRQRPGWYCWGNQAAGQR